MGKKKNFRPAPLDPPPEVLCRAKSLTDNPTDLNTSLSKSAFTTAWMRTRAVLDKEGLEIVGKLHPHEYTQIAIGLAGFALIQQSIYDLNDPTIAIRTLNARREEGARLVSEFKEWIWLEGNPK